MKKLILFFLVSLISLSVFADCPGNLCPGEYVTDKIGYYGEVEKINADGTFNVAIFSAGGYTLNFKREELFRAERCFQGFCIGDKVLDQYDEPGKLEMVFEKGVVRLEYDDFELPVLTTTIFTIKKI